MRDAVDISIRYALVSLLISTALSCAIIAFGFRVVQREIATRRRLTESLQAADRNKNEFLAILGHELRNPLAAVRNAIDVLDLLGPPSEPVEEMHGIIRRQTGVMGRLVDDLLDVSRIAHGKIELRHGQVDLAEVADAHDRRYLQHRGRRRRQHQVRRTEGAGLGTRRRNPPVAGGRQSAAQRDEILTAQRARHGEDRDRAPFAGSALTITDQGIGMDQARWNGYFILSRKERIMAIAAGADWGSDWRLPEA